MASKKISDQLEAIASAENFATSSAELTEAWSSSQLGVESVEPILRFMEKHPDLEYGMPGPLVHFIEEFYRNGYEEMLLESVARKPTMLTVWMLNRVLNGTEDSRERLAIVRVMRQAANHPEADQNTLESIRRFLERLDG